MKSSSQARLARDERCKYSRKSVAGGQQSAVSSQQSAVSSQQSAVSNNIISMRICLDKIKNILESYLISNLCAERHADF
jgi:hypothetical protein